MTMVSNPQFLQNHIKQVTRNNDAEGNHAKKGSNEFKGHHLFQDHGL